MSFDWLVGRTCTRVFEDVSESFAFEFGTGQLSVACLWRILVDGRPACVSRDHGHRFGLPAPVDAFSEAARLLAGKPVVAARWNDLTSDLFVEFAGGVLLEILLDYSGYEPWSFGAPGIHLIATGGNGIADFSPSARA